MERADFDANLIIPRLKRLYGARAEEAAVLILSAISQVELPASSRPSQQWSERDVVLITYGDQVRSDQGNPLQTLLRLLRERDLPRLINTIHFLPCFPYTSDDGFSVVDYHVIDPELGTWDDVEAIGGDCQLMLDLVLNHCSQASEWFQNYLASVPPYLKYFIEVDPATDVSQVTRPRSLPLLSEYQTDRGPRWVWTTFSRDQVDLNFAEPAVLAEMLRVLLEYVAHGARIIRLDAIAYLWKELGTSCIHLPQTHEVVKLMHDVLAQLAPQAILLTETNVPHEENVSYFGAGDEAQMVYQFALPPLLLDAFINGDAKPLKRWLKNLQSPPPGTTFFNFTASHDGVGVRPLEGHVDDARLQNLVDRVRDLGGAIGTRRQPNGDDTPYELNVSYLSALTPPNGEPEQHLQRFLTSQAVMLALQGMPAIYFHSLVGTENDLEGMRQSGIPRRINRRKFRLSELDQRLDAAGSLSAKVFTGVRRLLEIRTQQSAFHPDAEQHYHESGCDQVLCFQRIDPATGQTIFVASNFDSQPNLIELPPEYQGAVDLLGENSPALEGELLLKPAQTVWLEKRS